MAPRPADPLSNNQIRVRTARMKDGAWMRQVLGNLAGALLQAARWQVLLEQRQVPPEDWPRLPDDPGTAVELGTSRVDLDTAEGWETARKFLAEGHWEPFDWGKAVRELTDRLVNDLEHSPLLGAAFYARHSRRAGEILSSRGLPVTTLSGSYQSLWRKPEHPLGLPPKDHPSAQQLTAPEEEERALDQVAWEAARELYRSIGNPKPDAEGRCGLEQPAVLARWTERLGLFRPRAEVEPVGALEDETTHRAATGLPWAKAQSTLLSPRLEEQPGDLPPGQMHRPRDGKSFEALVSLADHSSAISDSPLAWAHLAQAQALLEAHGPEMARLSLYLSMHVCGQPDPSAPFLVTGETLLRDFGLTSTNGGGGRTAVLQRSDRLKRQAQMAQLLERVVVQCKDYSGAPDKKTGQRQFRRFTGRLWTISSLELGTETQLTIDGQTNVLADEVVTDLRLLVRAGDWVKLYLAEGAKGALWYGHVATAVLKLSLHRNQLAACLGLYLSTALREVRAHRTGEQTFTVGTLLDKTMPPAELQKARDDRRYGELLRNQWVAALDLLDRLIGFRFEFCPDTYPVWAIPEALRPEGITVPGRAPQGALEKLLKGHITIRWPAPVLKASSESKAQAGTRAKVKAVREARKLPPALQPVPGRSAPYGQQLREARQAAGLSQRAAGEILGISSAQLCKLEVGQKALTRAQLNRHIEHLAEHVRRERFERLTGG